MPASIDPRACTSRSNRTRTVQLRHRQPEPSAPRHFSDHHRYRFAYWQGLDRAAIRNARDRTCRKSPCESTTTSCCVSEPQNSGQLANSSRYATLNLTATISCRGLRPHDRFRRSRTPFGSWRRSGLASVHAGRRHCHAHVRGWSARAGSSSSNISRGSRSGLSEVPFPPRSSGRSMPGTLTWCTYRPRPSIAASPRRAARVSRSRRDTHQYLLSSTKTPKTPTPDLTPTRR